MLGQMVGQHSSTSIVHFVIKAPNLADVLIDILGTKLDNWDIANSHPGGRGNHFFKMAASGGQTLFFHWTHMQ